MKKLFAILIASFLLASGMQVTLDRHYCGGNLADVRVSITGKLASCGMESTNPSCPADGLLLRSHCCEDVVTFFSIDNNYTPSFPFLPETQNNNLNIFVSPVGLNNPPDASLKSLFSDISPPGNLLSTSVDLADICVFRI
jgi:hypothetical protein